MFLQSLQHGQAGIVGQAHVQQDGVRDEGLGQVVALVGTMGHQAVIAQLMSQVIEDVREVRFIFHHQDAATGKRPFVAVIVEARNVDLGNQRRQRLGFYAGGRHGRRHPHRLDRIFARFHIM
ncbi:hypothetical protein D3C81_1702580 [compost metagenome]